MDYTKIKEEINSYIESNFSDKRKLHTAGVVATSAELARRYSASPDKAEIAALFHDMFRGTGLTQLNCCVTQLGLEDKYIDNANLAHSKIAAAVMRRDFGINDDDIINAVEFHTTGRAGMGLLEKIIYLADAIEPSRDYPNVDKIRDEAFNDIDRACLMSLEKTAIFIRERGMFLDSDTIEAIDFLRKELSLNDKP